MRLIPLTRGLFATVDDDVFDFLSQWKWYAAKQPNTFYAARSEKRDGRKVTIWMHRVINETPDDMVTDHKNGNGLDNRKENLRSFTHQQNMLNNRRHTDRKPKYRGVSWHKSNKCWIAQITHNRRNIYLGRFDNAEAASVAYMKARAEIVKSVIGE